MVLCAVSGASERTAKQLNRVLRYHTLKDPQLHDTLRDLLAYLKAPAKGFSSVERLLIGKSECTSARISHVSDSRRDLFGGFFVFFKISRKCSLLFIFVLRTTA